MKFNIISVMPNLIEDGLKHGVIGSAFKKDVCALNLVNPRDFTQDVHQSVDDRPFGGGDGMLMMAEPLDQALQSCGSTGKTFYLSPQGEKFDDKMARSLSQEEELTFVCGRYGGVDQRFLNKNNIKEVSIGDYVLSGGELGALVMVDAIVRHLPGVLGHSASANEDSFAHDLLEAPYFTRPQSWQGREVPALLLSGDHKKIFEFKKQMSLVTTLMKRPDLLEGKSYDWQSCYHYFENFEPSELTFLPWSRKSILELIKERVNE